MAHGLTSTAYSVGVAQELTSYTRLIYCNDSLASCHYPTNSPVYKKTLIPALFKSRLRVLLWLSPAKKGTADTEHASYFT